MRYYLGAIVMALLLSGLQVGVEAQSIPRCVLLSAPMIDVTIPPVPPSRLIGGFAVRCAAGLRVRAELTSRGRLHGPLDLPYRLDTPVITFTGTGQPQTIEFMGHLTLSGAIGTMVLPSRYLDQPLVALAY
jgi:hypothetical protein